VIFMKKTQVMLEIKPVEVQNGLFNFFKKEEMPLIANSSQFSMVLGSVLQKENQDQDTKRGFGSSSLLREEPRPFASPTLFDPTKPLTISLILDEDKRLEEESRPKFPESVVQAGHNGSCSICGEYSKLTIVDFEKEQVLCFYCSIGVAEKRKSWTVPVEDRPEAEVVSNA